MKDYRSCLVCRKHHEAKYHHSQDEVSKAIDYLNNKHSTELLSSGDIEFIDGMFEGDPTNDDNAASGDEDVAEWVEDGYTGEYLEVFGLAA